MKRDRVVGDNRCNKITGYQQGALVDQLIKSMLPIGAWLTPYNRACGVGNFFSIPVYIFSIAFHISLLKISGKPVQVLVVGKYRFRCCTKKIHIPNSRSEE